MMEIPQTLKLGHGAFVELDRNVTDDWEINANNRVVARGQILVGDHMLAVSLTSLVKVASIDTGDTT